MGCSWTFLGVSVSMSVGSPWDAHGGCVDFMGGRRGVLGMSVDSS